MDERPAPAAELAGWFVVAEALTNAVKHAGAQELSVRVERDGRWLRVTVTDDGVGGASEAAGSGLRGMGDRVAALEGRIRVVSPAGAGTEIIVEIPWGTRRARRSD